MYQRLYIGCSHARSVTLYYSSFLFIERKTGAVALAIDRDMITQTDTDSNAHTKYHWLANWSWTVEKLYSILNEVNESIKAIDAINAHKHWIGTMYSWLTVFPLHRFIDVLSSLHWCDVQLNVKCALSACRTNTRTHTNIYDLHCFDNQNQAVQFNEVFEWLIFQQSFFCIIWLLSRHGHGLDWLSYRHKVIIYNGEQHDDCPWMRQRKFSSFIL